MRGLVLGGGGVTGIAWMTGVLLGLSERGFDPLSADRILGTSAGSAVAAQITSGHSLPDLFERQVNPALQTQELSPAPHLLELLLHAMPVLFSLNDVPERTRRIGHLALETTTVDEAARRRSIADRLPSHQWPVHPLATVAVDTATGEVRIFDRNSGVDLIDAVAASCAVPGLWPPVTLGGRRYMDGGIRSSDNADLASDCDTLLVLSPIGTHALSLPGGGLEQQVETRTRAGQKTRIIEPDESVRSAMGINPFDAKKRAPTAEAGRLQGQALGHELTLFWSGLHT